MLRFLFPRLTVDASPGEALFASATAEARQKHWYVEGAVPDTIDGRFGVLATITALLLVRLEFAGQRGNAASVSLTERFIEVMEAEHREIGLGDPTLGRTVRKLVGSLSRRVDLWRTAIGGDADWTGTARQSIYRDPVADEAVEHSAAALRRLYERIQAAGDAHLAEWRIQ